MNKNYVKEINSIVDVTKQIDCVNLSIGANNRDDFAWITNNLEVFKQESIENYNNVIASILHQKQMKLFFIVHDKKDTEFSAVEKHLGIWHRFKGVKMQNKSRDFYANSNFRYAYVELDSFETEQLSILHCGDLVFLKDDSVIADCLKELKEDDSIFDNFYSRGHLLATFRDLWTEGNALVFYAKGKQDLDEVIHIAQQEGFSNN